MRNIFLVIKHEITTMIGKWSFWIMTFLFPILILGMNIGVQVMAEDAFENEVRSSGRAGAVQAIGYVDKAGLIALPLPEMGEPLLAFPDEASARAALEAGELRQYYVIPADLLESGELELVDAAFSPIRSREGARTFEYIITLNLTQDQNLAAALLNPIAVEERHALDPEQKPEREEMLTFFVPFATMFIFFFSLTMSSGFMLQSVSKEKENRVVEVLLLSLRSRDLMLGKVLGLGSIALFQMLIWMGGGLLFMARGEALVEGLAAFTLPPGFALWGVLYFVMGYLLYGSVMAAIGALAPSAREGSQFTFMVLLPLMIPLWLNSTFTTNPDGGLATFLSLFPLTAPTSMMTRLAMGDVPAWQPVVGLLALAATTYAVVLVSARLFRADTLLSTLTLSWKRLGRELRQKL